MAISVSAKSDLALLNEIERNTFNYFIKYTDINSGLTTDCSRPGSPCSIAGVGFYLTSLVAAVENGWMSRKNAYLKAKTTFKTLAKNSKNNHGFYFHFIDVRTGRRVWGSELSSIDTALLMGGILIISEYFKGSNLAKEGMKLYNKVDWQWMLNNTDLMCHGYKPEQGFLPYYWDTYSEHLLLQILAIGADKHAIPPEKWTKWQRNKATVYNKNIVYSYSGSLFTYQYSHAFTDFKDFNDNGINYFSNSQNAIYANMQFCKKNSDKYKTYKQGYWGLTASLGPRGYKAYGAIPGKAFHDGTIAPHGIIASLPFMPQETMSTIKLMLRREKNNIYNDCGFIGAFNLDKKWYAKNCLAIDQGIIIMMIENYKRNLFWQYFERSKPFKNFLSRIKTIKNARGGI